LPARPAPMGLAMDSNLLIRARRRHRTLAVWSPVRPRPSGVGINRKPGFMLPATPTLAWDPCSRRTVIRGMDLGALRWGITRVMDLAAPRWGITLEMGARSTARYSRPTRMPAVRATILCWINNSSLCVAHSRNEWATHGEQ